VQDLPSPIRLPYIIAATRQARKDLKDIQNDHARHRENLLGSKLETDAQMNEPIGNEQRTDRNVCED
jgi:hypothetical protein